MSESRFNCLSKSCNVSGVDERMISCWLCLGVCHFKCSGLRTLVAEAVRNTDGIRWCCNDCRKIDAEFYRFYQSTKNAFTSLQKKMAGLSEELEAYGNLFEDFKQLRNFQTMESSPKRRKSARNKNKSNSEPVPDHNLLLTLPTTSAAATNQPIGTTTSSPSIAPIETVVTVSEVCSGDPGPSNGQVLKKVDNKAGPRQLIVIPPRKHIFVSRLAFDTTVDDVEFFLKSRLKDNVDINVHKFSYPQPRSISSFKISVPAQVYNQIMDHSFWPENILVREFQLKRNNDIARLPSVPKN